MSNPSIPPVPERRPAMWPWLVMPLATLALFFTLQKVREMPPPGSANAANRIGGSDSDTATP